MGTLNVKGHLWLPARGSSSAASFHATRDCPELVRLKEAGRGQNRRILWLDAKAESSAAGYTLSRCRCMRAWTDRGDSGVSVRTVGGGLPTLGGRRR